MAIMEAAADGEVTRTHACDDGRGGLGTRDTASIATGLCEETKGSPAGPLLCGERACTEVTACMSKVGRGRDRKGGFIARYGHASYSMLRIGQPPTLPLPQARTLQ